MQAVFAWDAAIRCSLRDVIFYDKDDTVRSIFKWFAS